MKCVNVSPNPYYENFIRIFFGLLAVQAFSQKFSEQKYYTLVVNPMKENIEMYWKDDLGRTIQTFEDLKAYLLAVVRFVTLLK